MNSSPAWQSLADKASALRCCAANLSAANGSSNLCALTSSRVSAALRQSGLGVAACGSASTACAAADAVARIKAAARQAKAGAAMATNAPFRTSADMFAIAAECNVNDARTEPAAPSVEPAPFSAHEVRDAIAPRPD